MNVWLEQLNHTSAAWAPWLWRVTWQAAAVIAAAWLLTMLLHRLSPRVRSWVWRLAYIKLLVLMVWTTPVRLALLPASADSSPWPVVSGQNHNSATAGRAETQIAAAQGLQIIPNPTGSAELPAAAPSAPSFNHDPQTSAELPTSITWESYLLLAWLSGTLFVAGWLGRDTWSALRLRRKLRPVDSAQLTALLDEVRRQLGLRYNVRLAECEAVTGPMLVKFITPCVVFPSGMLDHTAPSPHPSSFKGEGVTTLSPAEIRLVLAHELAHVKRHDLAWNALAIAVQALLYFHPLVWLANRWARQEQELACDELVVLRLGANAHDYGQMLVKIVQQISPNLRSGLLAVGMSGSFKTISHRLQAMKHIHAVTRRQIALAGCSLAVLATLTIVPWRLVAQEAKPAMESKLATAESATKEKSSPEELAVGTWRGGSDNEVELILRKDGTYSALYSQCFEFRSASGGRIVVGMPRPINESGRWQVSNGILSLTGEFEIPKLRGVTTPELARNDESGHARKFKIARLDQSLLRLEPEATENRTGLALGFEHAGDQPGRARRQGGRLTDEQLTTLFFHRDNENPSSDQFDASLPKELVRWAELARLTPKETLALKDWYERSHIERMHPEIIERVADARNGKIDFSTLFELTPQEVQGYQNLLKLTGDSYRNACQLADAGQLAPDEAAAVTKLRQFDINLKVIQETLQAGVASQAEGEARDKLKPFFDELRSYLDFVVFKNY